MREILWNISQGNHDEKLCKENCERNGEQFNDNHIPYHCKYSLERNSYHYPFGTASSCYAAPMLPGLAALLSTKITALLQKISSNRNPSPNHQNRWNRNKVEEQELVKFDLKVAQFKAMEIEVVEGRRAIEDLEQLRIEIDNM